MHTPNVKPLTLAITKGPSLTSASNYLHVNVLSPQGSDASVVAMCGRRGLLDSCPEVRPFMSLRRLPRKCTSLEPNITLPNYPDPGSRLDLGCGKNFLSNISHRNQSYLLAT